MAKGKKGGKKKPSKKGGKKKPSKKGGGKKPSKKGGKEKKGGKKGGKKGSFSKRVLAACFGVTLFILYILGAVEAVWGGITMRDMADVRMFCDAKYQVVPMFTMLCGIILIPACYCGLFGTTRDNFDLLKTTFRFLLSLCAIEIAVAVFSMILMGDIDGIFNKKIYLYVQRYTRLGEPVDRMQIFLECCGYTNKHEFPSGTPFSCCSTPGAVFCTETFNTGCKDALEDYISTIHLYGAVICAIGGVVKLLSLVALWFFARKVKQGVKYFADEDPAKLKKRKERQAKKSAKRKSKEKQRQSKQSKKKAAKGKGKKGSKGKGKKGSKGKGKKGSKGKGKKGSKGKGKKGSKGSKKKGKKK